MGAVLHQRPLQGFDSRHEAMEAAGGLFVADPAADPDALRDEVVARGVRALDLPAPLADLAFLHGLALEFLRVASTNVDIAPVNACGSLRALALDSWTGALDVGALPGLEWFAVTEVEPGQLDQLTGPGHHRLHHLSVGRCRERGLEALASIPRLVHLEIVDARSLSSLAAVSGLADLRKLDLVLCRALAALDGLEAAAGLTSLVLENCNRIGDLGVVAALPALRALKVDMRRPPSLLPLVGHPSLEYLQLVGGRRPEGEVTALLDNPALLVVQSARSMWMRTEDTWQHVPDMYDMPPDLAERRERLHRAQWELMAW